MNVAFGRRKFNRRIKPTGVSKWSSPVAEHEK